MQQSHEVGAGKLEIEILVRFARLIARQTAAVANDNTPLMEPPPKSPTFIATKSGSDQVPSPRPTEV
jgi:hypothetical protein